MHTCVYIKTHKSLKEPPAVWVEAKGGEDGMDTGETDLPKVAGIGRNKERKGNGLVSDAPGSH